MTMTLPDPSLAIAAHPSTGGIAPAVSPITMFCGVIGFSTFRRRRGFWC
jgi:hypothetical protein